MPSRRTPLVTGEIYHVLNRGVDGIPIYKNQADYLRFIQGLKYYRRTKTPLRLSMLLRLPESEHQKIVSNLEQQGDVFAEVIAYCPMPNHFHLLVKQTKDAGVTNLTRLATNSYARYFNTKHSRKGPLFEGRFETVRVETEEQLLHLSRYIHINPYTGFVVRDAKALLAYPFSSLPEYMGLLKDGFCHKDLILSHFKDVKEYKKFLLDRADYQRTLELIKHQILE